MSAETVKAMRVLKEMEIEILAKSLKMKELSAIEKSKIRYKLKELKKQGKSK